MWFLKALIVSVLVTTVAALVVDRIAGEVEKCRWHRAVAIIVAMIGSFFIVATAP